MPLTAKGRKILTRMSKEYGGKKGESVLYASRNKGTISGVDPESTKKQHNFLKMRSKAMEAKAAQTRKGK
jgi:hypothetical protein